MSAAIGIKGQPSRFAVLMKDSDSDDDETELKTRSRIQPKGVTKSNKKIEPAALKNAKKRARKKKNQSKGSQHEDSHEPAEKSEERIPVAQLADDCDDAFEKDLQEALLISKLEMEEREQLLAAEDHFKELKKNKKGIKLTLQELHCGEYENVLSPTSAAKQWPLMPTDDKNFFEDLSTSVKEELQKEKTKVAGKDTHSQLENMDTSQADAPRVADLKFQLEKRDSTVTDLEATVDKLNSELEEVKKRNQALCKILSKGEFSTKTELLEQVEQLISERDELALENGELHKALEQERSKNKHLTQELSKFQGSRHKTSSTSTT